MFVLPSICFDCGVSLYTYCTCYIFPPQRFVILRHTASVIPVSWLSCACAAFDELGIDGPHPVITLRSHHGAYRRQGLSIDLKYAIDTHKSRLFRGTIVNRTCGIHKHLYIGPSLLTTLDPINYCPP